MPNEPILVVDDNPINLKLLRVLLTGDGYQVRAAQDAEEALGILATFRPKMILMDIQLPGMDGYELTRRLKAAPATKDIVILAVTSYAMKGDEQHAIDAGCDGYLAKPIDVSGLSKTVAEWMARLA